MESTPCAKTEPHYLNWVSQELKGLFAWISLQDLDEIYPFEDEPAQNLCLDLSAGTRWNSQSVHHFTRSSALFEDTWAISGAQELVWISLFWNLPLNIHSSGSHPFPKQQQQHKTLDNLLVLREYFFHFEKQYVN